MRRRVFLRHVLRSSAAFGLSSGAFAAATEARERLRETVGTSPEEIAKDEAYWRQVSTLWAPAPDVVNLEYGYFHAAALPTLEAEIRMARFINSRNSRYKRGEMREDQEAARRELAAMAGVTPEEIAITRNATESLNIVIQGLDLAPGEEIVYGDQDYGSMVEALQQKALRTGCVLREAKIPVHPRSDDEIVAAFAAAMTPNTRLLHVTHLVNLSGQILPVKKISAMAHARGAEVIVDAAHSFAQLNFALSELDCDYLGSSLHKWTCSPLGMGLLYVRKSKIEKVWPLLADTRQAKDDIRKLEQLGTRPESAHVGLLEAIKLHREIGAPVKEARLRYLQRRWREAVAAVPGLVLNTPAAPERHVAVGNVGLEGVDPRELAAYWLREHNIFTASVSHPVIRGVRVTPGVPTLVEHVDRFAEAVHAAARHFG